MNENIKADIKSLMDNRVWVTKKARMEAEARMNQNHLFTQLLINYYTFIVLAFSIGTLVSQDTKMSLLTVNASVGLFGLSIFIGAMGYREKALQYKESYLSLNELEFNLKYLLRNEKQEKDTIIEELKGYEKKYTEVLTKSENHKDIDYIKVLIKHDMKVSTRDFFRYYTQKAMYFVCGVLVVVAPLIGTFIYLKS
ncbi:SLATT domain-containing protein [Bacillus zanthoxyli]